MSSPDFPPASLTGPLLAAVSRSFYLSLRFLPSPVRGPLGVSYLLARAADTIADVEARPAAERLALLAGFREAVNGHPPDGYFAAVAAFGADVTHAGERELLARLPEAFQAHAASPEPVQACARTVLDHILRGMELDLARFPDATRLRSLADAATLEEYAWLVAGSVGEFWTDICRIQMPGVYRRSPEEMSALAARYGKGLQLVNILRDQPGDAAIGRCYLPAEELHAAGLSGDPVWPAADWKPWHTVRRRWILQAREFLAAGRDYVQSVRSIRLRFAALLPLLIGEATLDLLESQPDDAAPAAAKIPRSAVKRHLRRAAAAAFTNRLPR